MSLENFPLKTWVRKNMFIEEEEWQGEGKENKCLVQGGKEEMSLEPEDPATERLKKH